MAINFQDFKMSGHGGARAGAGRPKGAVSRFNDEARARAAASGITPLDYLLKLLRDNTQTQEVRIDVAKAAAPYLHARLAAVEHSGGISLSHEEMLDELDGSREGDQASSEG